MAFVIDAGWVSAVASVVAVLLTFLIYLITRKRKYLSYEVLSQSPLISIGDEMKGGLQVLFNGRPVTNVHLFLIRFVNDGNVPVAASDYERPLTLRFADASSVLDAENTQASPGNLTPHVSSGGQTVTVAPVMLNPGDSFTVKVLVNQYSGKFDLDARVLGVNSLQTPPRGDRKVRVRLVAVGVVALIMLTAIGATLLSQLSSPHILSVEAASVFIRPGGGTLLKATVSNSARVVKYEWSTNRGKISGINDGQTAIYSAPDVPGRDLVILTITNDAGQMEVKAKFLTISSDAPPPDQSNQTP